VRLIADEMVSLI